MLAEQLHAKTEVSGRIAQAKLIECRNKFLGFLRKRLRNPQDAEDIFQDFCLKVLRNHATIKNGERLDAWLAITLRHTLTDYYRRQATRNRITEAYVNEAKIVGLETEEHVVEAACACIAAAMPKLAPDQAELLTRLDLQDQPREAIATDLEISQNTLRVRVHRARVALKNQIAEVCPMCGDGQFMECDCDHSREISDRAEAAF